MKALLLFCIFTLSLVQSMGQSKEIHNQYYSYSSTCHITYTTNQASVLTLNKDSTFILEVFVSHYDYNSTHTKASYSGQWRISNETIILKYFNQETKSISDRSLKTGFSPNRFVLSVMPVNCKSENGNLITDSKVLPIMNNTKSKIFALSEKWSFENLMIAKRNQKIEGRALSITEIKSN